MLRHQFSRLIVHVNTGCVSLASPAVSQLKSITVGSLDWLGLWSGTALPAYADLPIYQGVEAARPVSPLNGLYHKVSPIAPILLDCDGSLTISGHVIGWRESLTYDVLVPKKQSLCISVEIAARGHHCMGVCNNRHWRKTLKSSLACWFWINRVFPDAQNLAFWHIFNQNDPPPPKKKDLCFLSIYLPVHLNLRGGRKVVFRYIPGAKGC